MAGRWSVPAADVTSRECELTVVADHLFYEEIGEGNLEKTVMQMLWHVKEANAVFQSKV